MDSNNDINNFFKFVVLVTPNFWHLENRYTIQLIVDIIYYTDTNSQ